jgi:hypothetical protein
MANNYKNILIIKPSALGVTWEQAVNDREIRIKICKAARYWY